MLTDRSGSFTCWKRSGTVDKEVEERIREAARILREDGHSVRLGKIEEKLNKHVPDEPDPPDPNAPRPPPKKDDPGPPEPAKKSGWWPEGSLDDS